MVVDSTNIEEFVELPTLQQPWAPVLVDHSFGLKGGWATGIIRREPARQTVWLPYPLWNFGVSYRFDVPEQKNVGTIIFELQYIQKGYAYNLAYDEPEAYSQRFDIIELPILWQPYLSLGRGGSRVYLTAGPFISYTISSYEQYFDSTTGEVTSQGVYDLNPLNDYFWNYGVAVGGGFYVGIDRFAVSVDLRYSIQLSDMLRGPEYIAGNPFRTPVDHIGVSLGVHYTFWKNSNKKNGR